MKIKKVFYLIGIAVISIIMYVSANNDYLTHKDRNCVVIDKIQSIGGYKHHGNFYLVLREERGVVFDIIVDAATYTQAKKDQNITFSLRQMDIKQTPKENTLYFIGASIVLSFGFIFILCLIYLIFEK